jgi:glycosyltransferase involved in cell wall biosynthesis
VIGIQRLAVPGASNRAMLAPRLGRVEHPRSRGALPMRVCLVNLGAYAALVPSVNATIGGEEVQHATLARMLARRDDVSIRMVTCDFGQGRSVWVDGIAVHACYAPKAGIPGVRFLTPRWSGLHAALKRANADLYYVSCAGALLGQVALFTTFHRRKLVFRVASDGDCDPARMLVGSGKERVLYQLGLRRVDAIAAQTDAQRSMLLRNFAREAHCVPMVFDRPEVAAPSGARDIDVLWVANLRALKRPEKLLWLARQLPDRRIHLVGGEVEGESQAVRTVALHAASLRNLEWHGRLGYLETLRLFDRARVFVNTSRIEGFPNTFLQAWSRGVPTVSFVDPDELITREGLGRAVNDDTELEAAVRELLDDDATWTSVSQRCLKAIDRRYSADHMVDPYLRLFERTIGAPAA